MGEFILKYNLVLLLAANLASQFKPFSNLAPILFYSSLVLGVISTIVGFAYIKNSELRKAASLLFSFIIIYTLYQFTLGVQYWNLSGWNYYLARIVTLEIVFFGVVSNYDFYFKDLMFWMSVVIAGCVIFGTITDGTAAQGRYFLAFGNPNSTSAISTIGFAGFLFCKNRPKYIWLPGIVICLWGVAAGGSRTMSILCILSVLFRFKISFKTIALLVVLFFVLVNFLPYFGLKTIAIDRVVNVYETGNYVGGRTMMREATMMMINLKPIEGWGFKSGIQGEAATITELGSHNGYLDIIKAMGYPFAVILFFFIAKNVIRIRRYAFSGNPVEVYHCFLIIAVLIGAMYESMLHGVNYILNTVFYTSFALLTYRLYFHEEEEEDLTSMENDTPNY